MRTETVTRKLFTFDELSDDAKERARQWYREASAGDNYFAIVVKRRCAYNGRFAPNDARAYREYLTWPLLFPTRQSAQAFVRACFTFKGISGRKVSAAVRQVNFNGE